MVCSKDDDDLLSESESLIRQKVGRLVHSLWTSGGTDDSGLAAPFFDGRADRLGLYVMGLMDNHLQADAQSGKNEDAIDLSSQMMEDSSRSRTEIHRVHCQDLTYERFTREFMYPNIPVMIQGITDTWRASKEWTCTHKDGKVVPNMEYLLQEFGNDFVPVYRQKQKGFGPTRPCPLRDMTVKEYTDWWFSYKEMNRRDKASTTSSLEPLLYLKDWKFVAAHTDYNAYEWPIYFRDDWLNQAMGHAYKFVYLGPGMCRPICYMFSTESSTLSVVMPLTSPITVRLIVGPRSLAAGTSTVLHVDVLNSFSWSANVSGRKLWYLVPPQCTYLLYDCFGISLATHLFADLHVDSIDQSDGATTNVLFPGLAKVRKEIDKVLSASLHIHVPLFLSSLTRRLQIFHAGKKIRDSSVSGARGNHIRPIKVKNPLSSTPKG